MQKFEFFGTTGFSSAKLALEAIRSTFDDAECVVDGEKQTIHLTITLLASRTFNDLCDVVYSPDRVKKYLHWYPKIKNVEDCRGKFEIYLLNDRCPEMEERLQNLDKPKPSTPFLISKLSYDKLTLFSRELFDKAFQIYRSSQFSKDRDYKILAICCLLAAYESYYNEQGFKQSILSLKEWFNEIQVQPVGSKEFTQYSSPFISLVNHFMSRRICEVDSCLSYHIGMSLKLESINGYETVFPDDLEEKCNLNRSEFSEDYCLVAETLASIFQITNEGNFLQIKPYEVKDLENEEVYDIRPYDFIKILDESSRIESCVIKFNQITNGKRVEFFDKLVFTVLHHYNPGPYLMLFEEILLKCDLSEKKVIQCLTHMTCRMSKMIFSNKKTEIELKEKVEEIYTNIILKLVESKRLSIDPFSDKIISALFSIPVSKFHIKIFDMLFLLGLRLDRKLNCKILYAEYNSQDVCDFLPSIIVSWYFIHSQTKCIEEVLLLFQNSLTYINSDVKSEVANFLEKEAKLRRHIEMDFKDLKVFSECLEKSLSSQAPSLKGSQVQVFASGERKKVILEPGTIIKRLIKKGDLGFGSFYTAENENPSKLGTSVHYQDENGIPMAKSLCYFKVIEPFPVAKSVAKDAVDNWTSVLPVKAPGGAVQYEALIAIAEQSKYLEFIKEVKWSPSLGPNL
ncbi:MAG: hypothetical protein KDK62_02950 [Chlamydiia bacterium]|nr:hypothetical protein [Chlamydiia bacterium]